MIDFESIPDDISGNSSDNIELLYMLGAIWLESDTINDISSMHMLILLLYPDTVQFLRMYLQDHTKIVCERKFQNELT